jgi:hypothetical protein
MRDLDHGLSLNFQTRISDNNYQLIITKQYIADFIWRTYGSIITFLEALSHTINGDTLISFEIFADQVRDLNTISELLTLNFVNRILNNSSW